MTRGESILALGKDICLPAECEEALLGLLCAAAEERWTGRLRTGVKPEDCEEALRCACAFTAAAGILRRRGGGAGEAESAAIALEVQAARLMAPWCEGEDFAFLGVRA